ncbi:helix-turn-helix domain-containing protein [Lactobacillus delbrueckii subsp. bulgaricus]
MNRIKQLRTEKSFSLRDLAKDFSAFLDQHGKKPITNVTISRWENEKNSPTAEMWGLLADYFGVSVNYLRGAWSEKEVIELMSSSLLDNYERLSELDREYKEIYEDDPFQNRGLFGSMSLITEPTPWGYIGKNGSLESRTVQVRAIQKEILSNNYMALAFSIINLIYFDSALGNSVLKPEGDSKTDRYELANEQVNDLIIGLKKSAGQNIGKDFLKSYFRKHCFKSVLSSLVVRKLMAEKVEPETMALVLVNSIEGEILEMGIRVYRHKELDEIPFPDETESQSTNIDIDDLIQETNSLYGRIDELQKENDRLKAELASKR